MRWSTVHAVAPALLIALVGLTGCEKHKPSAAPPLDVGYVEAQRRDVDVVSEWIGTTQGFVTAEIRPKVQGYLLQQLYRDGAVVAAGAPLYRIDSAQYDAALKTAQGNLAKAQAELERTNINVKIYEPLAKKGAVSQLEYLDAVQQQKAAAASVDAAEGALQQARLNVAWTTVTSLISGVAGISQAKVGDLVSPTVVLTTVATLDPIKVEFPITEQQYLGFAPKGTGAGDAATFAKAPPMRIVLANGNDFPFEGKLQDFGLGVDPTTGTIKVQGLFPNPGGVLRPGQFVRVRAVTQHLSGATVVPQKAIVDVQGSPQVAVVSGADGFAMKAVKPGPVDGLDQVVLEGIAPGDKVIIDGLTRLRPGIKVTPKPVATEATAKPQAAAGASATSAAPPSPAAAPSAPAPAPQPAAGKAPASAGK